MSVDGTSQVDARSTSERLLTLSLILFPCRVLVGWLQLCQSTVEYLSSSSHHHASASAAESNDPLSRIDVHLSLIARWLQSHHRASDRLDRDRLPIAPVIGMLESMLQMNHETVLSKTQLIRMCQILMVSLMRRMSQTSSIASIVHVST
jgi:hypothetical protein